MPRIAKKSPNPVDKHVGARVRMRRMMLNMSQQKLGDSLGLTFQQVQKYEKGTNRVSGSRLHQIAGVLRVPVAFFFEGAPALHGKAPDIGGAPSAAAFVNDFLISRGGFRLARAFNRITNARLKHSIVDLVETLAGVDESDESKAA